MELIQNATIGLPALAIYAIVGGLTLMAAAAIRGLLTGHNIRDAVLDGNLAIALRSAGYMLGVAIIYSGAAYGALKHSAGYTPNAAFAIDLGITVGYALAGALALNGCYYLADRHIMKHFSTDKEVLEDRNCGVAAVEFGINVAFGLVVAAAVAGAGNPLHSLAFLAISALAVSMSVQLLQWVTPFNVHEELEKDNIAVGISMGGSIIAAGLVMFKASLGDFTTWADSLLSFAIYAAAGMLLLAVMHIAVDRLMFPKQRVHTLLVANNKAVALSEAGALLGCAVVLAFAA